MPAQMRVSPEDMAKVQGPGCAHGCPSCPHPAQGPAMLGSPNVIVNGCFAVRQDDIGMHTICCGMNMWTAKMGSSTVNINGKQAWRKDDMGQSCGGMVKCIGGSPNVIVGP